MGLQDLYVYGSGTSVAGAPVYNTTYGGFTPTGRIGGGYGFNVSGSGGGEGEKWLSGVLGGKNLPFSPFTQKQMLSQQSDMSAAAEGARNQQMMGAAAAGGASANDPSLRAAKLGNMAARQTQNQTAARDISAQASQQNFGAQMQAANALNQNAMQRAQWAASAASQYPLGMTPMSPWGGSLNSGWSSPSQTVGQGLYGGQPYGKYEYRQF